MESIYKKMKENEEYVPISIYDIDHGEANFVIVSENEGNIIFSVDCNKKNIKIEFKGLTPFYMYSEQAMRMATWSIAQNKNNDKELFKNNILYIVKNSFLSNIMELESCGFYSNINLKHYCIVTDQDIVDILSANDPVVYEQNTP